MDRADFESGRLKALPWARIEDAVLRLLAENERLARENQELQRRLRFYENPHTPPSLERRKRSQRPVGEAKKRGAPVGHAGATRAAPEPVRTVAVQDEVCVECQSKEIQAVGVEERNITEVDAALEPEATNFQLTKHACKRCGKTWTSSHPECPKVGAFGVRALTLVAMLRHHLRGPIRRVRDHLEHGHKLALSDSGVHDLLNRVEDACRDEYDKLLLRIRAAPYLHVDESSHKIEGKKVWMWIFRTPDNDCLLVIRPSRGEKVVDEILGDNPDQVVIVDGWSAYAGRKRQRCWAHLLRIVDEDKSSSPQAQTLSLRVHELYRELVAFHEGTHSMALRRAKHEAMEDAIQKLALDSIDREDLDGKLTYLRRGQGEWTTCLLHPGMPATNNPAEQALREHVVRRKLFQTFRSESGAERYQYVASLLDTWRLQGKDPFAELETVLRRALCT